MASFFDNKARSAAAKGKVQVKSNNISQTIKNDQPWVEKYRPKSLKDVAAQEHTVNVLQRTLQASNLPHMLFYGPPGTGKTSTILALAKELFGPEMFRSRVLELNASDERGISIVREKVKDFARMQLSNPPPQYSQKYPCPPFKIIILDEADSMTQDAQSALRRTMETYSKITRFCLVCNYVTRIIDPLASRCSKFRFKILDQSEARARVEFVAKAEGIDIDEQTAQTLIECSEGDLRRAITYLQSVSKFSTADETNGVERDESVKRRKMEIDTSSEDEEKAVTKSKGETVSTDDIYEVAGVIPEAVLADLLKSMKPNQRGSTYDRIAVEIENIVADGWSASQVLLQLHQILAFDDTISHQAKAKILLYMSDVDKRLTDGADEHLALLDLALQISRALSNV